MEPVRRRWAVLALLFFAIFVNVLDRQVLSLVAPKLREDLHLSNTEYGAILFCFLLGMTLGQLPAGWLMDRRGPRAGFPLTLVWWSAANMLHAAASGAWQFGAFRFLLGLGECGTYSGGVKVIGRWFPQRERALAAGVFNSGSLMAAIVAPPLITWLMLRHGWPAAFVLPSLAGLIWIVPWLLLYREPGVAASSLAPAEPVWGSLWWGLLRDPAVWGVVLMRAFGGPVSHFYWYWLPEYLKRERGLPFETIAAVAWLPFLTGGVGNIGGGWLSSRLILAGWSVDRARKTVFVGAGLCCMAAVAVPLAGSAGAALALISVASLGINALAANLMGLITDLFPERYLARVSGMTGVGDGAMSMVMMLAAGRVVDRYSFTPVFAAAGLFPLLSLASLFVLVRRIERRTEPRPQDRAGPV